MESGHNGGPHLDGKRWQTAANGISYKTESEQESEKEGKEREKRRGLDLTSRDENKLQSRRKELTHLETGRPQ